MRRVVFTIAIASVCAGGAVASAAMERAPQDRSSVRQPPVVCPGMSWKVGLHVELPCGPGAAILTSSFFEVRGGHCADVTYRRAVGAPAQTTTVCETEAPPLRRVQ